MATIMMQIKDIKGRSQIDNYKEWIEIGSFSFGVGRSVRGVSDREASTPSVSAVTVHKIMDETSPQLFTLATSGNAKDKTKEVKIHLCRTADKGYQSYMEYTLSDVLISSMSTSASAGQSEPSESLTLNFTKIEMTFKPSGKDAVSTNPVAAKYDLSSATS